MGELLDKITEKILRQIDGAGFEQKGAFNLRHNGIALCHGDSEHIKIKKKEGKQGIDIFIDGETKGEQVHIPVVVDASGMRDVVYNDFYIAEGADVTIVAGCGIHNSGCNELPEGYGRRDHRWKGGLCPCPEREPAPVL